MVIDVLNTDLFRVGLIISVSIAFFARAFFYHFITDDIVSATICRTKPVPKSRWLRLKHILCGTYYWDYLIPHLSTTLVHALNCALIYFLFGRSPVSLLVAFLFLLCPMNHQGSLWTAGQLYSKSTFCVLVMFLLPPLAPIMNFVALKYFGVSTLFSSLVFLFTPYKFIALMVPVFAFWQWQRIFNSKDKDSKMLTESNKELLSRRPEKLIIAIKTYGYYFLNSLIPFKISFFPKFLSEFGVDKAGTEKCYDIDKWFWAGLVSLYIVITNLIFNYSSTVFGLVWFTIHIAMWLNIVNLNQTASPRYVYLANVGLLYALAQCIMNIEQPVVRGFLVGAWILGFAVRLWFYMPAYKSIYWHNHYCVSEEPEYCYPWLLHGNQHFYQLGFKSALLDYFEARRWRPNDFKTNFNIAMAYIGLRQLGKARAYLALAGKCEVGGQEEKRDEEINKRLNVIVEIEKCIKHQLPYQIDINKIEPVI